MFFTSYCQAYAPLAAPLFSAGAYPMATYASAPYTVAPYTSTSFSSVNTGSPYMATYNAQPVTSGTTGGLFSGSLSNLLNQSFRLSMYAAQLQMVSSLMQAFTGRSRSASKEVATDDDRRKR
jgi:hypothetical protein